MIVDIDKYRYACHIDDRQYSHPATTTRGGPTKMLDMYATGTFAMDATDPRNQFHDRALHEARIATESRGYAAAAPHTSGLLERVRAALTGTQVGNTPEPCPCPA
jgi:hypothetical protein